MQESRGKNILAEGSAGSKALRWATAWLLQELVWSPGQVAELVRESSWYTTVAGLISGQGTYKNQPVALAVVAQWIERWL